MVRSSNPPIDGCTCKELIWRAGVGLRQVPTAAMEAGAAAAARAARLRDRGEDVRIIPAPMPVLPARPSVVAGRETSGVTDGVPNAGCATAGLGAGAVLFRAATPTPAPTSTTGVPSPALPLDAGAARIIDRIDPEAFAHVIVTLPGIFLGAATFERATAFVRGLETTLLLRIRTIDDIAALPTHRFRAVMENQVVADDREAIKRLEPVLTEIFAELQTMLNQE
ncbi:non-ribosomal peptide synthase [Microbacterium sp. HM58-2]|nr:non-ribosomal peptide synthase [Microbacterium sp. HM58-2]